MARSQDILAILRGVQMVVRAGIKEEEKNIQRLWSNSSVRSSVNDSLNVIVNKIKNPGEVVKVANESLDRFSTIATGINQYVMFSPKEKPKQGAK